MWSKIKEKFDLYLRSGISKGWESEIVIRSTRCSYLLFIVSGQSYSKQVIILQMLVPLRKACSGGVFNVKIFEHVCQFVYAGLHHFILFWCHSAGYYLGGMVVISLVYFISHELRYYHTEHRRRRRKLTVWRDLALERLTRKVWMKVIWCRI